MIFTNLVQANLRTKTLGQVIEYYTQLDSTNEEAWEMIDVGVKPGTVIITDRQLSGKGRNGAKWQSNADRSLTFSIVIQPNNLSGSMSGVFPLLSGVSIVCALREININAGLKWPNDIMINGKKIGGVLCKSRIQRKSINWVVLGIGINVNETAEDFENYISHSATSLYLEEGVFIQRERLLAAILNHLEILLNELDEDSESFDINKYWTPYCIHNNTHITFQDGDQVRHGRFKNIAKNGECIIEINGTTQSFTSASIKNVRGLDFIEQQSGKATHTDESGIF